jgi:hypothetical protein
LPSITSLPISMLTADFEMLIQWCRWAGSIVGRQSPKPHETLLPLRAPDDVAQAVRGFEIRLVGDDGRVVTCLLPGHLHRRGILGQEPAS